jgi:hypothetical protein
MNNFDTQVNQYARLNIVESIIGLLAFFYAFMGIQVGAIAQEKTDWQNYELPSYFLQPDSGMRAVGIARNGIFNDSLTQKQAFDRALQSLNANAGTWYFAEHFDNSLGSNYHSFYEFSIEQNVDSADVRITQQSTINNWLFMEIALIETKEADSATHWVEAVGASPMLWTNPYAAFEKAKQNAIKEVAFTIDLKIIGTQWAAGGYSGDLFFIKSKVLLKSVEVVSRRLVNGRCFVHIRVPKNSVTTF